MVTVYLMLCLISLQVVLNNSDIRAAIVNHMPNIEGHLARGWFHRNYQTAREYIAGERMDRNRTWGTDVEIVTIADLLRTKVY